jgi:hypothetical protein
MLRIPNDQHEVLKYDHYKWARGHVQLCFVPKKVEKNVDLPDLSNVINPFIIIALLSLNSVVLKIVLISVLTICMSTWIIKPQPTMTNSPAGRLSLFFDKPMAIFEKLISMGYGASAIDPQLIRKFNPVTLRVYKFHFINFLTYTGLDRLVWHGSSRIITSLKIVYNTIYRPIELATLDRVYLLRNLLMSGLIVALLMWSNIVVYLSSIAIIYGFMWYQYRMISGRIDHYTGDENVLNLVDVKCEMDLEVCGYDIWWFDYLMSYIVHNSWVNALIYDPNYRSSLKHATYYEAFSGKVIPDLHRYCRVLMRMKSLTVKQSGDVEIEGWCQFGTRFWGDASYHITQIYRNHHVIVCDRDDNDNEHRVEFLGKQVLHERYGTLLIQQSDDSDRHRGKIDYTYTISNERPVYRSLYDTKWVDGKYITGGTVTVDHEDHQQQIDYSNGQIINNRLMYPDGTIKVLDSDGYSSQLETCYTDRRYYYMKSKIDCFGETVEQSIFDYMHESMKDFEQILIHRKIKGHEVLRKIVIQKGVITENSYDDDTSSSETPINSTKSENKWVTNGCIGYKHAFTNANESCIVQLEIPRGSRVSHPEGHKLRTDKAIVLAIYRIVGTKIERYMGHAFSSYDPTFIYIVGQTVSVDNYDTNYRAQCSSGIHFFLSPELALSYGAHYPQDITNLDLIMNLEKRPDVTEGPKEVPKEVPTEVPTEVPKEVDEDWSDFDMSHAKEPKHLGKPTGKEHK